MRLQQQLGEQVGHKTHIHKLKKNLSAQNQVIKQIRASNYSKLKRRGQKIY